MAANLFDFAYNLEKALRSSEEFSSLIKVYQEVENDPVAKAKFDTFRNIQMQFHQMQMEGKDISETELKEAQAIAQQIQEDPKVTKLMEAEQRMSMTINELNKIIMKPLDELYGSING